VRELASREHTDPVGRRVRISRQTKVGEQVPDDDEDGAGDRDEGLELAAALTMR
jgi:hypothetical protein